MLYIDGLNLYFGLRSKSWRRYYWLDVRKLGERLVKPNQTLVGVRYFTVRISGPDRGKQKRLSAFPFNFRALISIRHDTNSTFHAIKSEIHYNVHRSNA